MTQKDSDCFTRSDMQTIDLESTILSAEDAIQCLTGLANVTIPMPNVRACNNLDEYFIKSTVNTQKTQSNHNQHAESSSKKSSTSVQPSLPREPFAVPLVRNFDRILKKPEQGDSAQTSTATMGLVYKPRKAKPDIFSRTEQLEATSGPLLHLKKRLDQTVKVLIRRRRKVPYISRVIEYKGTLVLFDKHMNMYLNNVIESFTYSFDGKFLKRARHRDNILVRGDNVILVA